MEGQKCTDEKQREVSKNCRSFVKEFQGRKVIVTFIGKEDVTDLLACYAERKASLMFQ